MMILNTIALSWIATDITIGSGSICDIGKGISTLIEKNVKKVSDLDKIKKVSVDAYRYGQEKVGQAQVFLEKNDVKGKSLLNRAKVSC